MTELRKSKINKISVSISIPLNFLEQIDERALKEHTSRSDFVVQALVEKLSKKK